MRTATLVLLVPLTAIAGLAFTRQPVFIVLGPLFLSPVLSRYFMRPSYRLTEESARASWGTAQTEMKWENVRSAVRSGETVRLSPVGARDFRSATRGVELILPPDPETRERALNSVRSHLPEPVSFISASE